MIRPGLLGLLGGTLLAACLSSAAAAAPQDRPLPPWSADTAAQPLRIVAFGTSLTAGGTWPADLAQALETCLGTSVQMVVIARPGMGSAWALEAVPQVLAAAPDLVLMEFAINDADLLDGVSLAQSAAQHRQILDRLRDSAPDRRVLLMTMSPVTGLIRRAQRPWLRRYHRLYAELAEEADTGVMDFTARWEADPEHLRAQQPDGLHPTAAAASALMVPPLATTIATAYPGADTPCPTD